MKDKPLKQQKPRDAGLSAAEFWKKASKQINKKNQESVRKKAEKQSEFDFSELQAKVDNYFVKRKEEFAKLYDKNESLDAFYQIEAENGMRFMLDYEKINKSETFEVLEPLTDESIKKNPLVFNKKVSGTFHGFDALSGGDRRASAPFHNSNQSKIGSKDFTTSNQSTKSLHTTSRSQINNIRHKSYESSFEDTKRITQIFPNDRLKEFEGPEIYKKLDIDTLFYIFYTSGPSIRRYYAAKELKNFAWRYHTLYNTWFLRVEEPKVLTEDYEQGTYNMFDFTAWAIKRKNNFCFEYKYLENIDL